MAAFLQWVKSGISHFFAAEGGGKPMKGLQEFFVFLLATALLQNLVLTTGFGSSIMLRIVRRPADIWLFGGFLTAFSVLTVLIAYPLDMLIGTSPTAKLLRPLMMIGHRSFAVCDHRLLAV